MKAHVSPTPPSTARVRVTSVRVTSLRLLQRALRPLLTRLFLSEREVRDLTPRAWHMETYDHIDERAIDLLRHVGIPVYVRAGGVGYAVDWPDTLPGYLWGEHGVLFEVAPGIFLLDEHALTEEAQRDTAAEALGDSLRTHRHAERHLRFLSTGVPATEERPGKQAGEHRRDTGHPRAAGF